MGLLLKTEREKQCVNITILDDELLEAPEKFSATLTNMPSTVASRVTLDPNHAVVDISDNDGKEQNLTFSPNLCRAYFVTLK